MASGTRDILAAATTVGAITVAGDIMDGLVTGLPTTATIRDTVAIGDLGIRMSARLPVAALPAAVADLPAEAVGLVAVAGSPTQRSVISSGSAGFSVWSRLILRGP